jgi:hypothetical protein
MSRRIPKAAKLPINDDKPKAKILLINGQPFDPLSLQTERQRKLIDFFDKRPNEVFTRADLSAKGFFSQTQFTLLTKNPAFKKYNCFEGRVRYFGCPSAIDLLMKTMKELRNDCNS